MNGGIISPQSNILRCGISVKLPSVCVMFFMGKAIEYLKETYEVYVIEEKLPCFLGYRCCYGIKGNDDVCFVDGGRGAPQAVDTLEVIHAMGVNKVIVVGMCGCFSSGYTVGNIIIPSKIYIEEGTSRHYDSLVEFSVPDLIMHNQAIEFFSREDIVVQKSVVSTDAIYRQTYQKEEEWRKRGCIAADMESSALLLVSKYLEIKSISILLVSDIHPMNESDMAWKWNLKKEERYRFVKRCIEFSVLISK